MKQIKRRPLGCVLIRSDWCPWKERLGHRETVGPMCPQRKKSSWAAAYKPRREASEETNPAGTLVLDWKS